MSSSRSILHRLALLLCDDSLLWAKYPTINPYLECCNAARAESHKIEVAGANDLVYVSKPKEVAAA